MTLRDGERWTLRNAPCSTAPSPASFDANTTREEVIAMYSRAANLAHMTRLCNRIESELTQADKDRLHGRVVGSRVFLGGVERAILEDETGRQFVWDPESGERVYGQWLWPADEAIHVTGTPGPEDAG